MKTDSLQAVILVAGKGERLRPLTAATPKSLLRIASEPILGHTIELLISAAIASITFVTGFHSEMIRRFVRSRFPAVRAKFVRNSAYSTTNTLVSLLHAKESIAGRPFLLIDGDLMFDAGVLKKILQRADGSVVACDSSISLDDEAVRAVGRKDGTVEAIGKKIDSSRTRTAFGESIGFARIDASASRRLFQIGPKLVRNGGLQFYYEAAFQQLIDEKFRFRAVDVRGNKWVEIDTFEDLDRARAHFHPQT
jgi:choline kinase